MERLFQVLLIASFVPFSWLGFMVVHECGHAAAAWITGGEVSRVVLHPVQISWTALGRNPYPLLVAWGGVVVGSLLPLGAWVTARNLRFSHEYLFRFFAGFCLVANGLYLLVDAYGRGGDGGTLIRYGAPAWQLLAFGVLATPGGFWLWHGLGQYFGLGEARGRVAHRAAVISASMLAFLVVVELWLYR
jgi:hypothetical protein